MPSNQISIFLTIFCFINLVVIDAGKTPIISGISSDQVKDIGGSVELNCTVENSRDVTVIWNKKSLEHPTDSVVLSMDSKLTLKDPRFSLNVDYSVGNYSLKITNIETSDVGRYECQIILSATEKYQQSVELLVRHSPVINTKLSTLSLTVTENQPANLICHADGYPRPEISWEREDRKLMPLGGFIYRGNVMKIQSAQKEDRGTYYCIANNGVGEPHRVGVSLEVEFAPVVYATRPRVAQALDYDIELQCKVLAYPPPTIFWTDQNHEDVTAKFDTRTETLSDQDEYTYSNLRLYSITKEHYGDYHCRALNKQGSDETKINLYETELAQSDYRITLNVSEALSIHKLRTIMTIGFTLIPALLINYHRLI